MFKNVFKQESVTNYAKATRQMARDGKKLMNKALGQLVEQMGLDSLEDLEGEQLQLITDYLSFCNKAFDLVELQADAMEAQDAKLASLEDKMDQLLKAVKK